MAYFLMRCLHHLGMEDRRDRMRPDHRRWVRSGGNGLACVLIGSALQDDTGKAIGNFGILEARSLQDARRFAEGDPFRTAGIVCEIDITRLPEGFRADRIAEPMSPPPDPGAA